MTLLFHGIDLMAQVAFVHHFIGYILHIPPVVAFVPKFGL